MVWELAEITAKCEHVFVHIIEHKKLLTSGGVFEFKIQLQQSVMRFEPEQT